MPDEERITQLREAIDASVADENWHHADLIYSELNKLVERDADAIRHHAYAVEKAGDPPRAATMLRLAIRMAPDNTEAILQLGSVYLSQQRHAEAEEAFRQVLAIDPDNVVGVRHLVQCLKNDEEGRAECEKLLRHALTIAPDDAAIWIQLGAIYANDAARFEDAAEAFEKGLELAPDSPTGYHNYGIVKRLQADLERSRELLERANELQPKDTNYAFSLALCHLFREDLDAARTWLEKSISYDPANNAAQVYLAFVMFHQGDMEAAWKQYETRLRLSEFKSLNFGRPRWEGEDLDGETVLMLREQGMGDNIQFVRYAKQIAERGGQVVVFAWPHLAELFATVPGVTSVTTAMLEPRNFHRFVPMLSVPYIVGTDTDSIPGDVPYMTAPDAKVAQWRDRLAEHPGFRVGLVWRGNPQHVNDRFRSTSLEAMSRLLGVDGATFFSLMKDRDEDTEPLPDGLHELGREFEDFSDTAAAMTVLDLVISVDTSVCHLAGALGRPVWTLLAKGPDFRWRIEGDTTPWYPTMSLYRQSRLGAWDDVLDRIEADLRDAVSKG